MDLRLHLCLGKQHEPLTPTQPLVLSWTTLVLQGGPIQKMNVASCQASIVAQSQEETAAWQQLQHLSLCLPKLKAVVDHAVLEPFVPTLPPN